MESTQAQEQLIDENKIYYEESLSKISSSLNLAPTSKDYYIISIIGVQNSGKSTLLNHLFGTNFKVLTTTSGTQTTKGIWISRDHQVPLVVLDVEGNDSMERAFDNDNNFEKGVAMYALSLSNVLIVNIWAKSVGTFEGSQYGILLTLMEMSMKMFKHEAPKVILFCLRDYNQDDNLQYITTTIIEDVEKIWAQIQKPSNLQKTPRDKFFQVKVHPLSIYRPAKQEQFLQDVAVLRQKVTDPNHPEYIFKGIDQSFNLPVKDLDELSKNAWKAISENKDLNLPNEKIQLASLRCNALKDTLIKQFTDELKELTRKPVTPQLRQSIEDLISVKTKTYDQQSHGYDKKVIKEKEGLLKVGINYAVEEEVERISKTKRDELLSNFEDVKASQFDRKVNLVDHLNKEVENRVKEFDSFQEEIGFGFPQKREMVNGFQHSLKTGAANKQKQLEQEAEQDFKVATGRMISTIVDDLLSNNLDQNFWAGAEKEFNRVLQVELDKYSDSRGWISNEKLTKPQIDEKKQYLYGQLKTEIKNRLELTIVDKLLEKFTKKFTKDPEGKTHNWLVMEDKKIEDVFDNAREGTLVINRAINNVPNFALDENETPDLIRQELFEPNKLSKMNDDLETKMTQEYENTIRSKKQTQMSKVPWYLWLIFLFFTYDDLWFGEDHPFVYYPSMVVLSVLALLLSMGYKGQLFAFFSFFIDKLKERFSFLR